MSTSSKYMKQQVASTPPEYWSTARRMSMAAPETHGESVPRIARAPECIGIEDGSGHETAKAERRDQALDQPGHAPGADQLDLPVRMPNQRADDPDRRIGVEWINQGSKRSLPKPCVGVENEQEVTARICERLLQSARKTKVPPVDPLCEPAGPAVGDDGRGIVGRSVVDVHNLDVDAGRYT